MTGGDPNEPIDAVDEEVLALLRSCHDTVDPMPAELVERVVFALALTDLDSVRLAEQRDLETVGARGEEARVITFDGDSLTVMIRISPQDGAVRVDGWLAPPPPDPALVELRMAHETVTVRADEDGRFVLEGVPRVLAQLAVRVGGTGRDDGEGSGGEETILAPAIVL